MQQHPKIKEEEDIKDIDIFQMSRYINKVEQIQQQQFASALAALLQQQNVSPPESPISDYSSSPSLMEQLHNQNYQKQNAADDDDDELAFLDDKILISTFQTLADFVNNEDEKNLKYSIPSQNKPNVIVTRKPNKNLNHTGKPRLYNFLREVLEDSAAYPCIEWVNKDSTAYPCEPKRKKIRTPNKNLNYTRKPRLYNFL